MIGILRHIMTPHWTFLCNPWETLTRELRKFVRQD